jgi:hypothetical protein
MRKGDGTGHYKGGIVMVRFGQCLSIIGLVFGTDRASLVIAMTA